ncbi:MAG TPA: hypothetical protein VGH54_10315 [Mycobacterium sp.]|jgi:hypothetical protein|uniref:hypothetical protein n=1 Tax=Mycobacterium sp. TaxID=1785 RepID=UPI002F42E2ED
MSTAITPAPDSRLEQLVSQYEMAQAEAKKAADDLKAITDAIKLEMTNAAPGETEIDLVSDQLARPLRLSNVTGWRVDAKKLKAEAPEVYVRYAVQTSSWRLAPVSR